MIEKVKQGSVADLVGHLLPGDLVLEWNGISLHSRTYEDVRDIIAASRQESSIELVVSRDIETPHTQPDWEEVERSTRNVCTLKETDNSTVFCSSKITCSACKGRCHLRFSGIRPLRGYPPPPP